MDHNNDDNDDDVGDEEEGRLRHGSRRFRTDGRRLAGAHGNEIRCVAVSADGRHVATGSYDKTVVLWDLPTEAVRAVLRGHSAVVTAVDFHGGLASGPTLLLLSGSSDTTVRIWQVDTAALLAVLYAHDSVVWSLRARPHAPAFLTTSQDRRIKLWHDTNYNNNINNNNDNNGNENRQWSHNGLTEESSWKEFAAVALAWHPSGRYFVSGHYDGAIRISPAAALAEGPTTVLLRGAHDDAAHCLAVSAGGRFIVSGSEDATVRVWRFPRMRDIARSAYNNNNDNDNDSDEDDEKNKHDYRFLSRDNNTEVPLSSCLLHTLRDHTLSVTSVAISPDSELIASGSYDNSIRLWQLFNGTLLHSIKADVGQINCLVFSPNGEKLIACGDQCAPVVVDDYDKELEVLFAGIKYAGFT